MSATSTIVIVGAGQAGCQIASSLRAGGYKGVVQLVGDEAALPYQRPPLSKAFLKRSAEADLVQLKPKQFYESNGIEVIGSDPALSVDRIAKTVQLRSGRVLRYDGLALATGCRPRLLGVQGAKLAGVYYLRTIGDAERLRNSLDAAQKVVIVGGGFIGLEVAASAATAGKNVVVLEAGERLMARAIAPGTSDFFLHHHQSLGIRVLLGVQVQRLYGSDRVTHVCLDGGARIEADLVLVGVGAEANDEIASAAGLKCDRGIVVDEFARTSDPSIVAAGDCAIAPSRCASGLVRLESVQNAIDQAKVAASSLMGEVKAHDNVPWFWSDQADVKLQTTGLPQGADSFVVRGDIDAKKFTIFHLRQGVVIAADSVNSPLDHMQSRQLIAKKLAPDQRQLSDAGFPLKSLLA